MSPSYPTGDLNISDTTFIPPKCWAFKTVSTHDSTAASSTLSNSGYSFRSGTETHVTYTTSVTTCRTEEEIKKLMKRMMDRWCIDSWNNYIPYYAQPKLQPINLRGVRLDGRGWANL
jgi:hypothetical protein